MLVLLDEAVGTWQIAVNMNLFGRDGKHDALETR
jgi:hypothetical protein